MAHKVSDANRVLAFPPHWGLSTLAVHAGEDRQKLGDSITDPIVCAATYTFSNTESLLTYVEQRLPREEYGRYGNPGEQALERKLAFLEGGEEGILYASGMAAIVGLLMAKLSGGDEMVFFDQCYHRSREFCVQALGSFRRRDPPGPTVNFVPWKLPSRPAPRC